MDHHLIGKLPFAESATLYPLEPCVPAVLPPPIPNRRKMKVLINLVAVMGLEILVVEIERVG